MMLVKPLAGQMVFAVSAGSLGCLLAQFIPIFGGFAILHCLGIEAPFSLESICVCIIVFAVLRAFLRYAEQKTNHFIAFTILAIIRDEVFQSLRKLCPAKLEGKNKGDLVSLITSDVELLEVFYAHTISPVCIAIIVSTSMVVFIASYHILLGIISAIAFIAVGIWVPNTVSEVSGDTGEQIRNHSAELSSTMLENIRGIETTIQFSNGNERTSKLISQTKELSSYQEKLNGITGFSNATTNTTILISDLVMFTSAILLYGNGSIGFDGLLISVLALMSSFGPVTALANLGTALQNTTASGERILSILDEKPETDDVTGQEYTEFKGAECRNVEFSYDDEQIIENFYMRFPENKIIGITGRSGSGKSTLLKLLMRFWEVQNGEIKISGKNIDSINTDNLREMESYVTQETQIFNDTVANNIRIAKLDASLAEIKNACQKASINEFIEKLPDGYNTNVGELGENFSGGERQRIGLARAFLHNAPFLLLDEPTSNLDSLNEAVILKSIKEEAEGKTVVLVSHRISTVRIADKIYSVDKGRKS